MSGSTLEIAIEALEKIRLAEDVDFDDEMQCDVPVAMTADEMQEIADKAIMQIVGAWVDGKPWAAEQ